MDFDPGNGNFLVVDGQIVERDALHIAEKIQDYDPDLQLLCLDPDNLHAHVTDAPFVVVRRRDDGRYERVLEAWQLDDRIIERIWAADSARNNQLEQLIALENKKKKEKEDADREVMMQNHELFRAALANPKSEFSFENKEGDLVTISDTEGVKKNKGRQSF